jgi:hypothetical protein
VSSQLLVDVVLFWRAAVARENARALLCPRKTKPKVTTRTEAV